MKFMLYKSNILQHLLKDRVWSLRQEVVLDLCQKQESNTETETKTENGHGTKLGPDTRIGSGYDMGSSYVYKTQNEDGPVIEAVLGTLSGHETRTETESELETGAGTRSEPETGRERSGPAEQGSKPLTDDLGPEGWQDWKDHEQHTGWTFSFHL